METSQAIVDFLGRQSLLVGLLRAVAELGIEDCWVGAGLIRNAVWDHLHGYPIKPVVGSDVDVVYCDHACRSLERDAEIEKRLKDAVPGIPWSVHNQARMHERNGDAPYASTEEAVRCWPETATAIAARLCSNQLQIMAPLGVEDLLRMIVRPTPAFKHKLEIFRIRLASKDWKQRWPKLRFVDT